MDWRTAAWLVVDIETTGFGPEPGICELGAVIMREGQVIAHRSGLFNPKKAISPFASRVHGIWDSHVAHRRHVADPNPDNGLTAADTIDQLCAEHDVQAIVGYNCRTSDLPIMRREMGLPWARIEGAIGIVIDVLRVVRKAMPERRGAGGHKLGAVAEFLGLLGPEGDMEPRPHWAVSDCVYTGRVLWHLHDHLPSDAREVYEMMEPQIAEAVTP